jgi:hypothetical protein
VAGMDRERHETVCGRTGAPAHTHRAFRSLQENHAFLGGTGYTELDSPRTACCCSRPALRMSQPSAVCASLPSHAFLDCSIPGTSAEGQDVLVASKGKLGGATWVAGSG